MSKLTKARVGAPNNNKISQEVGPHLPAGLQQPVVQQNAPTKLVKPAEVIPSLEVQATKHNALGFWEILKEVVWNILCFMFKWGYVKPDAESQKSTSFCRAEKPIGHCRRTRSTASIA